MTRCLSTKAGQVHFDQHSLTVTLPGGLSPGTYYIGAIADYNDPNIGTNAPSPTYDVMQITVTGAGASTVTAVSTAAGGLVLASDAGDSNDDPYSLLSQSPPASPPPPPSPPGPFNQVGLPDTVVGFSDGIANGLHGPGGAALTPVLGSSQIVDGATILSPTGSAPIVLGNPLAHGMFA